MNHWVRDVGIAGINIFESHHHGPVGTWRLRNQQVGVEVVGLAGFDAETVVEYSHTFGRVDNIDIVCSHIASVEVESGETAVVVAIDEVDRNDSVVFVCEAYLHRGLEA